MKEIPTKNNSLALSLRRLNRAQSAGFAFTASSVLTLFLSVLFAVAIAACGWTLTEDKPDWYLYVSFLLPQLAFLVVALLCVFAVKMPVKEIVGKPSWRYFLLAVLLQFGLLSLSQVNSYFIEFLQRFGYTPNLVEIPSTKGFGMVGVLFVVALLPSVLEETIFRGVILRGVKGWGAVPAVLLCGAIFALYHQNPVQTVYQFCCGAAFALLALRAGSVLPTMLAHFINNAIIILVYHFTGQDTFFLPWYVTVMAGVCLLGTLAYLIFAEKKRGEAPQERQEEKKEREKGFLPFVAIGVIVCLVNWVTALFS